jgi:hypothetical protein
MTKEEIAAQIPAKTPIGIEIEGEMPPLADIFDAWVAERFPMLPVSAAEILAADSGHFELWLDRMNTRRQFYKGGGKLCNDAQPNVPLRREYASGF